MKPLVILNVLLAIILSAVITILLIERHQGRNRIVSSDVVIQPNPVKAKAEELVNGIYEFEIKKTPASSGGLITLDLRSDRSFVMTVEGKMLPFPKTAKGTWSIDGDRITLSSLPKSPFRIDGIDLISESGQRYIKLR